MNIIMKSFILKMLLSRLYNWKINPGSRINAVPCILQEALRIGGTSVIDWRTAPALETANNATKSSSHALLGVET
tara:strand:+ start:133 stop:357 length:225 start_codon:yes stop_codon:yes gene_type:complete